MAERSCLDSKAAWRASADCGTCAPPGGCSSAEMKSVAGGATGLLTVTWKQFGAGEERQLIPEYRMVTANHCITRALRLLRDPARSGDGRHRATRGRGFTLNK